MSGYVYLIKKKSALEKLEANGVVRVMRALESVSVRHHCQTTSAKRRRR